MKNTILFQLLCISVLLTGCQFQEIDDLMNGDIVTTSEFYGNIEGPASTRTYLEDLQVKWSEGDEICIFEGTSSACRYRINEEYVGTSSGRFDKYSGGSQNTASVFGNNIAFYPYDSKITCTSAEKGAYLLSDIFIEPKQDWFEGSFHGERFPMVAVSSDLKDKELGFRNVFGGIIFQIKGDGKVMYMTIKGRCGEKIAGGADVKCFSDGTAPVIYMKDNAFETVSLYCGTGVQLSENDPTDFYITLPPTEFKEGFTLTVYDSAGKMTVFESHRVQTIERSALLRMPVIDMGVKESFDDPVDLSVDGTANSYIVSESGCYKLPAVKGNSSETIGPVASVEIIWESFGTEELPQVGDLITAASYKDGYVLFKTPEVFREGNALIAAKDASGNILWSWHIWLVEDEIQEHMYANGSGIMMDRNLGATTPSSDGGCQIGLRYQWGRKDPFMGQYSVATADHATSSAPVSIESTIQNPNTLFFKSPEGVILFENVGGDWCNVNDMQRWASEKTIYDPCPAGWRVPDGGNESVWVLSGLSDSDYRYYDHQLWISAECSGYDAFYPFTGSDRRVVMSDTYYSSYWTATAIDQEFSYDFGFSSWYRSMSLEIDGKMYKDWRAAVRCYKIGSYTMGEYVPVTDVTLDYASIILAEGEAMVLNADVSPKNATDRNIVWLSSDSRTVSVADGTVRAIKAGTATVKAVCGGVVAVCTVNVIKASDKSMAEDLDVGGNSANCYIVSEKGCYRFRTFKGNSQMSVGNVASAEVLWETFGTQRAPLAGELIRDVEYEDGYVYLWTSEEYKEGNAVIAVKDDLGNILWSWHIWMTDIPEEHIYANSAGVLMDRNLGAVSSSPDDVGAFGLAYQWGRKDPFTGRASVLMYDVRAEYAGSSDGYVVVDGETGNIEYSISHPTKFMSGPNDWIYDEGADGGTGRWDIDKTIYDPCPAGWRVASGGYDGTLYKAGVRLSSCSHTSAGMIVPAGFSGGADAYFPMSSALRGYHNSGVEIRFPAMSLFFCAPARCWTVTPYTDTYFPTFYTLDFGLDPAGYNNYEIIPAAALAVRCQKL